MKRNKTNRKSVSRNGTGQSSGNQMEKDENRPESFEELLSEYLDNPLKYKDGFADKEVANVGEIVKEYPKPQNSIDLHGKTAKEAEMHVQWFIEHGLAEGLLTLRVISGRGSHSSSGRPILFETVNRLLVRLRRDGTILSFALEKRSKNGAFIVWLPKRSRM